MGKARVFTTLPVRMIADARPTALDIRCAAAIALRDGMSQLKGKGGGCYAKLATLADDANTDITNFSKSLSRLVKWGYVLREPQQMDKRRHTLRIAYSDADEVGEPTNNKVGEAANNPAEIVGNEGGFDPEIVGEADSKNGSFSRETCGHYSSLREELDSVETGELNSLKGRTLRRVDQEIARNGRPDPSGISKANSAEAVLSDEGFSTHLPKNLEALPIGAQVARYEAAFNAIGRDPDKLNRDERAKLNHFLHDISETFLGGDQDAVAQQAARLLEETMVY